MCTFKVNHVNYAVHRDSPWDNIHSLVTIKGINI